MSLATVDRRRRVHDAALMANRQARAVELAVCGWSYGAIARELGYKNRSGAWKAVSVLFVTGSPTGWTSHENSNWPDWRSFIKPTRTLHWLGTSGPPP